jgi:pimeloyl-ACP methyl ester carboxylesterase
MKIKILIIIFLILVTGSGIYFYWQNNKKQRMGEEMKKVSFVTKDGVTIVANYYPNEDAKFAGLLIHMRPKTKESFDEFAKLLQKEGYAVLAIDLRGHGESISSVFGKLDYQRFTEEEEKRSIEDLYSASLFLEKENYPKEKQFLVGASIGANLSFQFLSENPEIKAAVLLSPGLNYRGIILENFKKEGLGEKIMVVASQDDEPAILALKKLKEWYPNVYSFEYQIGGHGTNLFHSIPNLQEKIINWLREKLI